MTIQKYREDSQSAISNLIKSDTPSLLEPRLQGQILLTLRRLSRSYTVSTS